MVCLVSLVLLIVFMGPAHAYVDAGSGSYVLQMILAGFLAAVFSAKLYWQRVKTFAVNLLHGQRRPVSRDGV